MQNWALLNHIDHIEAAPIAHWAWLLMLSTVFRFARDFSTAHQNLPTQQVVWNSMAAMCMNLASNCMGWSSATVTWGNYYLLCLTSAPIKWGASGLWGLWKTGYLYIKVRAQEILAISIIISCQLMFFTFMVKSVGQGGPEWRMLFQSLIPLNDYSDPDKK